MKFPNIPSLPSQVISEQSQTDLKYMEDYEEYLSQENLDPHISPSEPHRTGNPSGKDKGSLRSENTQGRISKKKSLIKQQKGISSINGMPIKKTQSSQVRNSSINYTKSYSKKFSEFRQVKSSEFESIYKTFNMFSSQFITFNQLILALKSLGVEIETQKKFETVKNMYDEFVGKNEVGIEFEGFGRITIKLLREERGKIESDFSHIEKGFYYMVQEANKIRWPFDQEEEQKHTPKELFDEFKLYVDRLPAEKKYLTKDSLIYLSKYLGMETQLTQNDIENIMKYGDKEEKVYLSFEDVIKYIQGNKIVEI